MRPLERKIVNSLLDRIRRERNSREEAVDPRVLAGGKATRREATFDDFPAIARLEKKEGLGYDSISNWQRLWRDNPAIRHWPEPPGIGWVLETERGIVGFLGSIPLKYEFRNRVLRAVATHALVVESHYRAMTFSLITAFFKQPGIDLFLNTTAVPAVGRLMKPFAADAVPQSNYGDVLFWIVNAPEFVRSSMNKLGLKNGWTSAVQGIASLALRADVTFRRRYPRAQDTTLRVDCEDASTLTAQLDRLWNSLRQSSSRLLADRSAETLHWHFCPQAARGEVHWLTARRDGILVGYLVMVNIRESDSGLLRSVVADLFCGENDRNAVTALLVTAYRRAELTGGHVLEILGFPKWVREVCSTWRPYSRSYPACPFYYKTREPALAHELQHERAWYASPYDGDGTLSA